MSYVETTSSHQSVCLSVCDLVSVTKPICQIFKNLVQEFCSKKLLSKHKFCEHWLSNIYTQGFI
jgi:hypothetical protein